MFKKIDRVILLLILFTATYSLTTGVYVGIKYREWSMVFTPVLITTIGIWFYIVHRRILRKSASQVPSQAEVDRMYKKRYDSKWFIPLHILLLVLFIGDLGFLYCDADYKETDKQFKEAMDWYEEMDNSDVVPIAEMLKLNSHTVSRDKKKSIITVVEMIEDVTDVAEKIKNVAEKSKEEQKQVIEESKNALAEKQLYLEEMRNTIVLTAFCKTYLILYYFVLYPRDYVRYQELQKKVNCSAIQ